MSRVLTALVILVLGGCSIVLQPDYDAIAPELDASPDGDTGTASCQPTEVRELSCDDGEDNDCDEAIDCFDLDCRGAPTCCRGGEAIRHCLASTDFVRLPMGKEADVVFSSDRCAEGDALIEFGPAGVPRALVSECQPINFGMELRASFRIATACPPASSCSDYAALALTPVDTMVDREPLISELRVVVSPSGSVAIDRAGHPLGEAIPEGTFRVDDRVDLVVSLEPGPDERGRDVLYATIDVAGHSRLLERGAVMPLESLRCLSPAGPQIGLRVAIEGAGNDVYVLGPLTTNERACANPSQFQAQDEVSLATPAGCALGGAGAPALVSYCRSNCRNPEEAQYQTDLWVDASEEERADELFRFVDFGICGYAWERAHFPNGVAEDDWAERGAPGYLWPIGPPWRSAREPTLLAISDDAGARRVDKLWYAYAERVGEGLEEYALYAGEVLTSSASAPTRPRAPLVTPEAVGCASLRDPLLLARYARTEGNAYVDGAWLAFTCVQRGLAENSIRAVRLDASLTVVPDSLQTLLTSAIGAYAERGVFAPEGFMEPGERTTLRLWFLARDASGVHLAFAQGRTEDPDLLPALAPYPANPILTGDSPILGGDCSAGCTLTGASVTLSTERRSHYQFVIARSRNTPSGPVHDLVPLLQPAPDD